MARRMKQHPSRQCQHSFVVEYKAGHMQTPIQGEAGQSAGGNIRITQTGLSMDWVRLVREGCVPAPPKPRRRRRRRKLTWRGKVRHGREFGCAYRQNGVEVGIGGGGRGNIRAASVCGPQSLQYHLDTRHHLVRLARGEGSPSSSPAEEEEKEEEE